MSYTSWPYARFRTAESPRPRSIVTDGPLPLRQSNITSRSSALITTVTKPVRRFPTFSPDSERIPADERLDLNGRLHW
jgi:hypothetical protein